MSTLDTKAEAYRALLADWSLEALDLERLRTVIAFIRKHPKQHDQSSWFERAPLHTPGGDNQPEKPWDCGTTACIAGWTLLLDGRYGYTEPGWSTHLARIDLEPNEHGQPEIVDVQDEATDLLGLTEAWRDVLFAGERTRAEIMSIYRIFNGDRDLPERIPVWFVHPWGRRSYRWLGDGWIHEIEYQHIRQLNLAVGLDEQSDEALEAIGLSRAEVTG